jgi:hypothetical protein
MNVSQVLVLIVPGLLAAIGAIGAPWIASRYRARSAEAVSAAKLSVQRRKTDWEISSDLRDAIYEEMSRVREELRGAREQMRALQEAEDECQRIRDDLQRQVGISADRITRLEEQVRRGDPGGNLGRAGGQSA